ncbi:hypothetical protein K466DRAFT_371074 [Polyporus arcularius HHB13444]|uniref:Uncharacterized protein n=1 Tax=Polyporus arcularius HHB13444 TaxID=1314778 RepID=A0A5C3PME2_9APHY|nr:hypothetical protein K466DRAFT_371074 [Polyporus arcularius HHB13444]
MTGHACGGYSGVRTRDWSGLRYLNTLPVISLTLLCVWAGAWRRSRRILRTFVQHWWYRRLLANTQSLLVYRLVHAPVMRGCISYQVRAKGGFDSPTESCHCGFVIFCTKKTWTSEPNRSSVHM